MRINSKLVNIMGHFGYAFVSFDPVKNNFKFVRKVLENGFIHVYIKYTYLTMSKPRFIDYNIQTTNWDTRNLLFLDNKAISDRVKIREAFEERW